MRSACWILLFWAHQMLLLENLHFLQWLLWCRILFVDSTQLTELHLNGFDCSVDRKYNHCRSRHNCIAPHMFCLHPTKIVSQRKKQFLDSNFAIWNDSSCRFSFSLFFLTALMVSKKSYKASMRMPLLSSGVLMLIRSKSMSSMSTVQFAEGRLLPLFLR